MSSLENVENQPNKLVTNYDFSKTFLYDIQTERATLVNAAPGDADTVYAIGTLMGRVAADNQIVPCVSTATDGSQFPVGVLMEEVTGLATAATKDVNIAVGGEIAQEKLIIDAGDTLDTVIDDKTLADRIKSDTIGIKLVEVDELSDFDNQ
jgi:hypothetical protein